ncbi:TIGR03016 family PEP-CTERM system-associated outer membrane protein [Humitalea sp. 24SJ18S-53]|uniref:TIGR03016 family PEP-CTERM system-associated outer membrane protein n=1 Tax=Humitalea sp. 24SJ18S-53 TaxID=3422307 RepID=UPI003D6667F9
MTRDAHAVLRIAGLGAALGASLPVISPTAMAQVPMPTQATVPGGSAVAAPAPGTGTGTGTGGAQGGTVGAEPTIAGVRPSGLRIGALGFPYSTDTPAADDLARGWRLTPSLTTQVLATDNINLTATNRRADMVFSVTPGLLFEVDTARLKGVVNLSPTFQAYGSDSSQNGINQNGNGQLLATVIPEAVFVDIRGAAAVQAAGGGYAPQGNAVTTRNDQVQTTTFQVSPYYVHRFGSTATVQVGYAFQYVKQDIGGNGSGGVTPTGQTFFTNQDFTGNEFYAVARTGEDFGRFAMEGRVVSTDYAGTGVFDGAYRRIATVETRYAITRQVAALVEVGYQSLNYAGTPGYTIEEPVWSVGTRLNLSPDSQITVKYGHRDGVDSAFLQAAVALGGRTTLYANYSDTLTTAAQTAVDLLSTTTLDELGNPIDIATGAPVAQPFANSFTAVQSGLMRVRSGGLTISQVWPRDTFSFSLYRQELTPVSAAIGTTAFPQNNSYGTLSWAHELTETTTSIIQLQAGTFESPGQSSGNLFSASLSLVHQLTPSLSGLLQFITTLNDQDNGIGRATQNVVLVSLRKTFEDVQ